MSNTVRTLDVPRLNTIAGLKLAAEQAARHTGAEGVAIAIGNAMVMCCCASVGNAPDVGVMVGPDSGLSGICMRTSEAVHCDDAATDPRVDPVAGQRMNLRSVLIVPVVADGRLQGMLQVVSSKPHAFHAQHREHLSRMAQGIATLLSDAASALPKPSTIEHQAVSTIAESPAKRIEAAVPSPAISAAPGKDDTRAPAPRSSVAPAPRISPAAAAVAARREQSSAVPAARVSRAVESPDVLFSPPAPRSFSPKAMAGVAILILAVLAVGWYVIGGRDNSTAVGSAPVTKASAAPSATPEQRTQPDAAPEITVEQSSLSVAGGEEAPNVSGSAPQLTPGRLVRKVEPVYPASARAQHVSGSVVLTALVTKDGTVANVQFVRGPEALASPAIEAVRQWVYEPYRLGGVPVEVRTMIDMKFTFRQKP